MNVWRKIADVILKVVEGGELDASLMPIFGGLAPLFLLKLSGHLNLEVDEDMRNKIQENPLIQPLVMDALSLISATSNVSSEEEFDEHLDNMVPPPLASLIRIAMEYLGDEIEFSFAHPQFGAKGRITGQGLSLIVRNGAKYI